MVVPHLDRRPGRADRWRVCWQVDKKHFSRRFTDEAEARAFGASIVTPPRTTYTDKERIAARIEVAPNGCWNWTGSKNPTGYGVISIKKRGTFRAHRLSYEAYVGPIPEGLVLDHLCRNRACVNPEHLEPVTQGENTRRSPLTFQSINAAKTHCVNGHAFTKDNIIWREGGRRCRTCASWRWRRSRQLAADTAATSVGGAS